MKHLLFIATLVLLSSSCQSTEIHWDAVGDDGMIGTAAGYELIYSLDSNDVIFSNDGINGWSGWGNATVITANSMPTPQAAGAAEQFTLTGLLTDTTYYVALKAFDNAGNYSIEAPFLILVVPDGIAPATIVLRLVP